MINENVQTAIVLEDDADWDIEIHDIFQTLSVQMRKGELRKQKATNYEMNHAPYGKFNLGEQFPLPLSSGLCLSRPRY